MKIEYQKIDDEKNAQVVSGIFFIWKYIQNMFRYFDTIFVVVGVFMALGGLSNLFSAVPDYQSGFLALGMGVVFAVAPLYTRRKVQALPEIIKTELVRKLGGGPELEKTLNDLEADMKDRYDKA